MTRQVLVLSSNDDFDASVQTALSTLPFTTTGARDIHEAIARLASGDIFAIVICEGPDFPDATVLCHRLRLSTEIPIMLVCSRDSESRLTHSTDMGHTDYMIDPFPDDSFTARMRILIGNSAKRASSSSTDGLLSADGIVMDLESRTTWAGDTEIPLTKIEFDILSLLMSKPNRVFSRSEIINDVWRDQWYGDDHVLETHVSRLRKKIQMHGGPRLLTCLRGVGYRFRNSVAPQRRRAPPQPRVD